MCQCLMKQILYVYLNNMKTKLGNWRTAFLFALLIVLVSSCASSPPKNTSNLCEIFKEKRSWYKHAKKASKRWNIPIAVNMAFIHQESRFVAKAKPPRKKILWVIPGPRKSSAYGYSQAKDDTWDWYKKNSGHRGADRNDFDDAIDFVAWYNHTSAKTLGIKRDDAYALYLAYHEGMGGFKRRTFQSKAWLKKVAGKVAWQAKLYQDQLNSCERKLGR